MSQSVKSSSRARGGRERFGGVMQKFDNFRASTGHSLSYVAKITCTTASVMQQHLHRRNYLETYVIVK